jgi:hypothetical protein
MRLQFEMESSDDRIRIINCERTNVSHGLDLARATQGISVSKQCVGIGADASGGQMRSVTYRILIWLSFIDKPSCSTRLLIAFQPVSLDAKWTYRFMPKSAGFIIS